MEKYCKCGCGKEIVIKPKHKYRGIPDYIKGHYSKTKEHRIKMSKAMKKVWQNSDYLKNGDIKNYHLNFLIF